MPRLQVFLKIFTVAKDIVPGCYSGEYSNKVQSLPPYAQEVYRVLVLQLSLVLINHVDSVICAHAAIRLNCPIEVILVPPRRAEVILDNHRSHMSTSLSKTGNAATVWTFAGVDQRNNSSSATTDIVGVLDFHFCSP